MLAATIPNQHALWVSLMHVLSVMSTFACHACMKCLPLQSHPTHLPLEVAYSQFNCVYDTEFVRGFSTPSVHVLTLVLVRSVRLRVP
jgi:hypothetical protein